MGQLLSFDAGTGQWRSQAAQGFSDGMGRFVVLTDEQLRNLQQPTATPGSPQPPLPGDRPDCKPTWK